MNFIAWAAGGSRGTGGSNGPLRHREDSPHLPSPAAQAMKFINGLDVEIESYLQLTAHCENSLSVFETDRRLPKEPSFLPNVLPFLRFHRFKSMN